MGFRDRATEFIRDTTGLAVIEGEELDGLKESVEQFSRFRDDAEDLAFWSLNYTTSRPQELLPERRRRVAQKARVAWMKDPIAGTEAEHYANFALGRGINPPRAKDEAVQKIIDRAWKDANNVEKLTSLDALRALSHELRTGANVYVLLFRGNGKVRVSFLSADEVEEVVTMDEDKLRALYYVARTRRGKWSYTNHQYVVDSDSGIDVTYYPHWRNVEEAEREAKDFGMEKPKRPPASHLGKGQVYHLRVNRLLEQHFGVPYWNRTLRFMSALNRLMEARVSMAQAASSLIAKRVVKGGEKDVVKAANSILQQTGEIGAASAQREAATGLKAPLRPGSVMTENESSRLEAVSLNSGAGNAQTDMSSVRGAAISPSAMGQHYFGAGDSTNLATAACHDELTETLTDEGWMTYEQLRERDAAGTLPRIAGFDQVTHQVQYHKPLQKMLQYDYDGELIHFANNRNDIMVTEDHRMFVGNRDSWGFREAKDLGARRHDTLKAGAPVGGIRQETFTLPGCTVRPDRARPISPEVESRIRSVAEIAFKRLAVDHREGYCACGCGGLTTISPRNRYDSEGNLKIGKGERVKILPGHNPKPLNVGEIATLAGVSTREARRVLHAVRDRSHLRAYRPAVSIKMDAFLYWLGWYVSEGSGGGEVAQCENSPFLPGIQAACRNLGVPGIEKWKGDGSKPGGRMWHWKPRNPMQWQHWLHENCGQGARNKRIPDFVFALPADQQMRVLRGLMEGDGACGQDDTWERQGCSVFGSSSPQLSDDVQRLAINCGFRATRKSGGLVSLIATKELSPSRRWRGGVSRMPQGKRVAYRGRVYCFTLPTDTMITRRNGHVAFHGNTLELPALMAVGAWQEVFEQLLRWFTDMAIEEAVRAGELGGAIPDDEADVPLSELRLTEAEDQAEAERRTKKDLSYSFDMPYPGRRNLPEVTSTFTSVLSQLSPIGENPILTETMLNFLFTHGLQLENAPDLAKQVTDAQSKILKDQEKAAAAQAQAAAEPPVDPNAPEEPDPSDQPGVPNNTTGKQETDQSVYGEKRTTTPGDQVAESYLPVALEADVDQMLTDITRMLTVGVEEPAVRAAVIRGE